MLRLLVIEDEPRVAAHIDGVLSKQGLDVIGPAGSLEEAKLLACFEELDGALLDVNIDGGRIDDVADILMERKIPFLFVTSCGREDLPLNHQEAILVPKPFRDADLIRAVRRLKPEWRGEIS